MIINKPVLTAISLVFALTASAPAFSATQGKDPEKRWARMLKRVDLNGDQKISRQELQTQIDRTFAALDANRDGGLSMDELQNQKSALKDANQKLRATRVSGQRSMRVMKMPHAVLKRFDRLDADKNGMLTNAEISKIANKLFTRRDRNKDGYLSAADRAS